MKILLSSFGFESPILRAKYEHVMQTGEGFLEKTCVIIPYAGYNCEVTGEVEKRHLVEFGFDAGNIFVADGEGAFGCELAEIDYIYVPGGDPFKLLNMLKQFELCERIKELILEKGAVYIGVSAGAYVATSNIEYVTQLEDNNVIEDDFVGLGLISEGVICHADHYSYSTYKACEEILDKTIIRINDDELWLYEDGR